MSIIGEIGLDGLNYGPTQATETVDFHFGLEELAEEANAVLNDSKPIDELESLFLLGGSSGGARLKAHIKTEGEIGLSNFRVERIFQMRGLPNLKKMPQPKGADLM